MDLRIKSEGDDFGVSNSTRVIERRPTADAAIQNHLERHMLYQTALDRRASLAMTWGQ